MERSNMQHCYEDPTCTVENILATVKKRQVNEINKNRKPFSECHYLFPLLKQYDEKFRQYMRMEVRTFEYILAKVTDSLTKHWCNLHKQPIKPEQKLVVTIRFLATGASYSSLSFSFLMGKSTISYLIEDVLTAIWKELGPTHMPVPSVDMFHDISHDFFLLWDVPHCIGTIHVRHIRIKKPNHSGSRYYNNKHFFSITLQAVVDARYRFIMIDVGGYGHQHDATTFRNSCLYKALKAGKLKIPEEDELYDSDTTLPYFFIGDNGYPLSDNLIKPYPGRKLSQKKLFFNKRISRARVCVECAFGRLCQKFRIFYCTIQHSPEMTELIVKSACVLQNVIIDIENPSTVVPSPSLADSSVLAEDERETDEVLTAVGNIVRKKLIQFFVKNPVQ